MSVTDIIRDEHTFIGGAWKTIPANVEKELHKYNTSFTRFTFYLWGVFITSYSRSNLFSGLLAFGNDYLYADTDSIKSINTEKHMDFIKAYNDNVISRLKAVADYYEIPFEKFVPKNIKGEKKPLGVWEWETEKEPYKHFKTLGAKRYAIETSKGFSFTVAGVNKKAAVPWMLEKFGKDGFFKAFDFSLTVPTEYTGKLTHTYSAPGKEIRGSLIDYTGRKDTYHEYSFIHLGGAEYNFSLGKDFAKFLKGVRFERT